MAGKTPYLTADDFIKGIVVEPEDFDVPGWGRVRLRGVTTLEMQRINAQAKGDEAKLMAWAVKVGLVEPELPDSAIDSLASGQAGKISTIATRIMQLSGMGATEQAAEEIEGEAGGSL